jgi:O-antigen ligase
MNESSTSSGACLAGLCALLMASVLAFGAVEIWATSVLEIGSVLLLGCWAICQIQAPELRVKWSPLYLPMLAFGLLVCVQIATNTTVYRYATLLVGLQYVAFSALLFLALQVVGDERSSKIFFLTMGLFGFAVAAFAICQDLIAHGRFYWAQTPLAPASVFGTYVNHNHYAGLMEMLAPLALVLSVSRLLQGGQRMLAGFAAVLMAGSIVLSGSRSGTFSLLIELAFLFWTASRVRRRSAFRYGLLLLSCCVFAFLVWIGSGDLWHHFGDLNDQFRPAILKDSLGMFRLKPILGWGLGTFPTAYPAYRSFYTDLFINAAHNDYLQALVETGAVGFACVVWFIAILYRQAFKQMTDWAHHWDGALRVATLTGCTGLLVHTALDFNLQIPANAALFCVFCAISTNYKRSPAGGATVCHFVSTQLSGRKRIIFHESTRMKKQSESYAPASSI